jgi:hypothetical protein
MSTLINFSMKINGHYQNITMIINDETDQYGNNASIWLAQTKEQREAKEKKTYVGNGKVTWTDGKIVKAEFVEREKKDDKDLLPF